MNATSDELSPLKAALKRVLGEKMVGVIDYYRHSRLRQSWGGPFNGQSHRQKMVQAFIRQLPLDAIVETGTYRGTTTAYLAGLTPLPIYTVEISPRFQGFNWLALRRFKNVLRFGGDSRAFLRTLTSTKPEADKAVLFYLDAHWNADCPLVEELEIIFGHWRRALVLVDDFRVDDDPGYGFDDYGSGNALTLDCIGKPLSQFGLHVFFPSAPSSAETGSKRGSVVLAADAVVSGQLRKMPEIREHFGGVTERKSPSVADRDLHARSL
jgi:hypothetical protein